MCKRIEKKCTKYFYILLAMCFFFIICNNTRIPKKQTTGQYPCLGGQYLPTEMIDHLNTQVFLQIEPAEILSSWLVTYILYLKGMSFREVDYPSFCRLS